MFSNMIGGAHDPQAVELSDERLIGLAMQDLDACLGVKSQPYFTRLFRHPRGIPQYSLEHLRRLENIEQFVAGYPGLWTCGNSYRGISINACIEEAPGIAEAVLEHLAESGAAAANG